MVYLLSSLGCLPPAIFCSKKPAGAAWAKKNVKKTKKLLIQKYYLSCLADKWILFFGSIC